MDTWQIVIICLTLASTLMNNFFIFLQTIRENHLYSTCCAGKCCLLEDDLSMQAGGAQSVKIEQ
jgi:hypothetical protein